MITVERRNIGYRIRDIDWSKKELNEELKMIRKTSQDLREVNRKIQQKKGIYLYGEYRLQKDLKPLNDDSKRF